MATKVGSFIMGLVLARLLAPADFGLYAIALAATGFVLHVNDVGLIAATVQWRGRLDEVAPTASSLAALFSFSVYGAFWLLAPRFAELAGNPDATPIVRLLTLVIVVDGITAVRVAALQRHFQQDRLAVANMVGFVAQAPVAVVIAFSGGGPYAFVLGQLTQSVITGCVVFAWAGVPLVYRVERAIAAKLLRYGVPLAASLGIEAILMNADYVIVGRLTGAASLGFYLLAFNVSSWVAGTLGTAIRYVSVAGFSRLAEQDGALAVGVQRAVPLLITGVLPLVTIIGILANPLIAFLYGAKWDAAAPVLSVLMALAVIRLLAGLALDVLMGSGATRAALWLNAGWAVALVPALAVGTQKGGIVGTAVAHVLVGMLVALPLSALALHRVGVDLAPIARAIFRPILATLLAGLATWSVAQMSTLPVVELIAGGAAGVAVYIFGAFSPERIGHFARKSSGSLRRTRGATPVTQSYEG